MTEKTGDCFEVAGTIVSCLGRWDDIPDLCHGARLGMRTLKALDIPAGMLVLVHGFVTRPTDQLRHVHAWIEWREKGLVFDFSNGHQVMMPRQLYYEAGQVLDYRAYNVDEARIEMVESAHYGPWHKEFTDEQPA